MVNKNIMGVIDKIKGRMSGYNALTKGPAKHHGPAHCDVDYMHSSYWNDMRKRNAPGPGKAGEFDTMGFDSGKGRTRGTDTVAAGLAAGNAAAPPQEKDMGSEIAEVGSNIGKAIMTASENEKGKPSERREFIDSKKEEGLTGKEARAAYKEKKKGAKAINKYLKENPIGFIKI
ncbi:MAG: hypothetical protein GY787_18335 [Alteromonadales bacterium]|nr:hypothetical protein [Alteromonadales bacterium]